jgi:hypothetical protein
MKTDKSRLPDTVLDIRVRDRHLAAGTLDPKVLEQHLAELPDLEAQSESLLIDQPALNPRDSE